jgi:hypothetical protein
VYSSGVILDADGDEVGMVEGYRVVQQELDLYPTWWCKTSLLDHNTF